MEAENKYDVILEKVGNQPLKTTKVLCSVLGLGLAAAKGMVDKAPINIATGIDEAKALDLKKQLEESGNTVSVPGLKLDDGSSLGKKAASNKTAADADDAFDAIFGAGAAQTATPTVKSKGKAKNETEKTASKAAEKAETKTATKKKSAAVNDDFDALFGGTASK